MGISNTLTEELQQSYPHIFGNWRIVTFPMKSSGKLWEGQTPSHQLPGDVNFVSLRNWRLFITPRRQPSTKDMRSLTIADSGLLSCWLKRKEKNGSLGNIADTGLLSCWLKRKEKNGSLGNNSNIVIVMFMFLFNLCQLLLFSEDWGSALMKLLVRIN